MELVKVLAFTLLVTFSWIFMCWAAFNEERED